MNFERWQHLRDFRHPPACMDWRHVCMINCVLEEQQPKSIVEIGCWRGFSTSAIIEAHEKHPFDFVDLVDYRITPEVKKIIPREFNAMPMNSWDYRGNPQAWLIDGNHDFGAISDYAKALVARPSIIFIHDSNGMNHPLIRYNAGASFIAALMKRDAYCHFEDCGDREGERTHRGLTIGFFGMEPEKRTVDRLLYMSSRDFKAPEWRLENEDGKQIYHEPEFVGAPK